MSKSNFFAALAIFLAWQPSANAFSRVGAFATSADIVIDSIPATNDTLLLKDTLKESVVSSLKIGGTIKETPASVNVVTSLDVKKDVSTTVGDVLDKEPGLNKGGDGVWSTNVNVRGFSENRLVTLVDRNRVEVANDLTLSLSMFDVNDIERVEVIKGAQSSIYGSGAMGGIVNIVTKDGHFAPSTYFNGNVSANYETANTGHNEYVALYAGGKKWYAKVNGSYGQGQDMKTPEGYMSNSGYHMANAGVIAAYKPVEDQILKVQYQGNYSWDVGIPGGAAFSPIATATYKKADRTLADVTYELKNLAPTFENLRLKAFYQGIVCDVEMLPNAPEPTAGARPVRVTPYAEHHSFGFSGDGLWKFGTLNTLSGGVEMWQRRIHSARDYYIDVYNDGKVVNHMTKSDIPLPDASYTSVGLFAQDEMRFLEDRMIFTFGGRIDVNHVKNDECPTFAAGSRTDPSWSANAGLLFRADSKCDVVFNVSSSYRSPALEELFKFIDLNGNKVRYGNPSLSPEQGLGGDIGVRFHGDKLNFNVSAFVNGIRNMIVERKVNVEPTSVNDTLVLQNAGRALLYGFDFDISYEFIRGLKLFASGDWTIGREISNNWSSLPNIPPLNGRVGLSYDNPGILGASFECVAAGARKEGQIADGERSTQAWYRLDLAIHSKIFSFGRCALQLFAGMNNITNQTYTNFLATNRGNIIYEPGRNFFIRANFTF